MLRLILGRAGSGKTYEILRRLRETAKQTAASRCILLIPEQFSFETERTLLRTLGAQAASEIKVYSFTRLAEMVEKEMGGFAGRPLDNATRVLLMSEALTQVGDRLTVYRHGGNVDMLIDQMLDFSDECKQGGITPERLMETGVSSGDDLLLGKLTDLSLVLGAYEALTAQAYVDPKDALAHLCEHLPHSELVHGTHIFVDGFKGFTAQELQVLGGLMGRAAEITVTLCTDTLQADDAVTQLFYVPTHTAAQLTALARERRFPIAAPVYLTEDRRHTAYSLRFLESHLLRNSSEQWEEAAPEVTVTACADVYAECDLAARTVRRLLREDGLRCRDIAIVARSLGDYRGVLDAALEKADIPYFMDMRDSIAGEPLAVTVRSALHCVCENFRGEDVLRLVKSDLLGFSARSAALLDEYAYLWNIQGARWKQTWQEHPDGLMVRADETTERRLHHLNLLRRRVIRPLETLQKAVAGDPNGAQFAKAVYMYLKQARVDRLVRLQTARLAAAGETELAERSARVWDTVMELLDTFAAVLGQTTGKASHFAELLRRMMLATDLGSIPQQLDAVQVGAADRIRFSAPRAVLILGANEGVFPAVPNTVSVLTDRDRRKLKAMELPLAGMVEEQLAEERFFVYAAASAPSERLYVSYVQGAGEKDSASPSVLVHELRRLLPRHDDGTARQDQIASFEYGKEMFCRMAEEIQVKNDTYATLQSALLRIPAMQERTRRVERAAAAVPAHFESGDNAKRLFGEHMVLSASRVDTFYECRFRYFCRYGMRVSAARQADLNALEFGSVLHYVMQHQVPEYARIGFDKVTREQVSTDADRLIRTYVEENMGGLEQKPARFLYLLERMAVLGGRLLWQVVSEMRQSRFVPTDYELAIAPGAEEDALQAVRLTLPDGGSVRIRGSIDRVDVFRDGETAYVRVVDYKTGSKAFSLDEVVEGLNLQMLIYMSTIWANGTARYGSVTPAGMLYLPSKMALVEVGEGDDEAKIEEKRLRQLRMNGLLLDNVEVLEAMESDLAGVFIPAKGGKKGVSSKSLATLHQMGLLKQRAERLLCEMGAALQQGEIAAIPALHDNDRTPCTYCDYRSVCGFEEGDACRPIPAGGYAQFLKDSEEEIS